MPDRELSKDEIQLFVNESAGGEIGFHALRTFMEEKTKPTLHDLCLEELYARIEGLTKMLIDSARELKLAQERIGFLQEKINHRKW